MMNVTVYGDGRDHFFSSMVFPLALGRFEPSQLGLADAASQVGPAAFGAT